MTQRLYLSRMFLLWTVAFSLLLSQACLVSAQDEGDNDQEDADDILDAPYTTTIRGRLQYPDKSPFNMTTQIVLNHGERSTYCRVRDGCNFEIVNVPPGVHQLDVLSTTHHFPTVKIQVLADGSDPKCLEYAFAGANKNAVKHPLALTAYATFDYFEVRRGFSVWMIFKNPMVLMMGFSAVLMFFMPKMMEGLDPEEKARMKQQMEMQQDPSKMLNSLWEGFSGEDPAAAAAKKKPIKSTAKK